MSLEKIKEIAEQMPESPEKQVALQAYLNLKTFEVIADSFGRNSLITWTGADLRKERQEMENDFDYECTTCHHRTTVPFDRFYPPDVCSECGDALSFLSKEKIEENELINAREA